MLNCFRKNKLQSSSQNESVTPRPRPFFLTLNPWLESFLHEERGVVAPLIGLVLFLGMMFTGVAIDYSNYVAATQQLKIIGDNVGVTGGIACREMFLRSKLEGLPAEDLITLTTREARNIANEAFDKAKVSLPPSITTTSNEAIVSMPATGPGGMPEQCFVTINYTASSSNTFATLFGVKGFPVVGNVTAEARLEDIPSPLLEIDFLFDVSGSMSTIASSKDRNLVAALTPTVEGHGDQVKGCIFFCHLRNALLPGTISRKILGVIDGTISSIEADYAYKYNGGKVEIPTNTITPMPKNIRTYKYIGPSTKTGATLNNSELVSVRDVLDAFEIKLKSDELFASMTTLINNLQASPDQDRIKVAFHRFHDNLETFIPEREPNEVQSLSTLPPDALAPYHFEFGVAQTEASFFLPGDFTPAPSNLNTYPLFAPPQSSSGLDSIARPTNNPDYIVKNARYYTYIPRVFDQLLSKINARTQPTGPTQRIAIIITDGVKDETNSTGTTASVRLLSPDICRALKDRGVLLMIVHSYYRLQPGHTSSDGLRSIVPELSLPRTTASNVDNNEILINERGLRDKFLLPCASRNPNAKPGEFQSYYYPANNILQLEESFQELLVSILGVTAKEPPVRILE
jgi:hypothetical protein